MYFFAVPDDRELLHALSKRLLRRSHFPPRHQGLHGTNGKAYFFFALCARSAVLLKRHFSAKKIRP